MIIKNIDNTVNDLSSLLDIKYQRMYIDNAIFVNNDIENGRSLISCYMSSISIMESVFTSNKSYVFIPQYTLNIFGLCFYRWNERFNRFCGY